MYISSGKISGKSAITKIQAVIILVILVVAAVVGITYAVSRPQTVTIGVASSNDLGSAGAPLTFTVIPTPSSATVKSVSWNFGDGVTATSSGAETSHTYANSGSYLIEANATVSSSSGLFSSTSTVSDDKGIVSVQVGSNLSATAAADGSLPSIGFPSATNPGAPLFSTGTTLAPVAGFHEQPSTAITQSSRTLGTLAMVSPRPSAPLAREQLRPM